MLGSTLGEIVSPVITGLLCDSELLGGWPSAFYMFGNKPAFSLFFLYSYRERCGFATFVFVIVVVVVAVIVVVHCVSKNIPNIFDCNLKKN